MGVIRHGHNIENIKVKHRFLIIIFSIVNYFNSCGREKKKLMED